jgi:hypothetical protein
VTVPTIRKRVTVAFGGVPVFPLTGDQYEYLPFPARVQFAIIGLSTAGIATTATVYSGSDVLQQNGPITQRAAGATNPTFPDDFLLDDVAGQGERLNVVLTNSGTVNDTVEVVAIVTPL